MGTWAKPSAFLPAPRGGASGGFFRDFEYDFESDKLAHHRVSFEEAVECFFSNFVVRRNKQFKDRFQLIGRTWAGKPMKIIFQLKPGNVVRIITGWPL